MMISNRNLLFQGSIFREKMLVLGRVIHPKDGFFLFHGILSGPQKIHKGWFGTCFIAGYPLSMVHNPLSWPLAFWKKTHIWHWCLVARFPIVGVRSGFIDSWENGDVPVQFMRSLECHHCGTHFLALHHMQNEGFSTTLSKTLDSVLFKSCFIKVPPSSQKVCIARDHSKGPNATSKGPQAQQFAGRQSFMHLSGYLKHDSGS